MAIVNIKLRGISYQISCKDGEEDNVLQVADRFTVKFDEMAASIPRANDAMLLLLTGLTLQSKILEQEKGHFDAISPAEKSSSEVIDAVSEYIESLVNKLKEL